MSALLRDSNGRMVVPQLDKAHFDAAGAASRVKAVGKPPGCKPMNLAIAAGR